MPRKLTRALRVILLYTGNDDARIACIHDGASIGIFQMSESTLDKKFVSRTWKLPNHYSSI